MKVTFRELFPDTTNEKFPQIDNPLFTNCFDFAVAFSMVNERVGSEERYCKSVSGGRHPTVSAGPFTKESFPVLAYTLKRMYDQGLDENYRSGPMVGNFKDTMRAYALNALKTECNVRKSRFLCIDDRVRNSRLRGERCIPVTSGEDDMGDLDDCVGCGMLDMNSDRRALTAAEVDDIFVRCSCPPDDLGLIHEAFEWSKLIGFREDGKGRKKSGHVIEAGVRMAEPAELSILCLCEIDGLGTSAIGRKAGIWAMRMMPLSRVQLDNVMIECSDGPGTIWVCREKIPEGLLAASSGGRVIVLHDAADIDALASMVAELMNRKGGRRHA